MNNSEMETRFQRIESDCQNNTEKIEDLTVAIVGTADGSKIGFRHLIATAFKELESYGKVIENHSKRMNDMELIQVRYEGTFQGIKSTVVVMWSIIGLITGGGFGSIITWIVIASHR